MVSPRGTTRVITCDGLNTLLGALRSRGYRLVGPTVRDGAIVYDDLSSASDLPVGWTEQHEAGHYRLQRREDKARFGYTVGPDAWKKFFFPPRRRLWRLRINGAEFEPTDEREPVEKCALIGVRSCDLNAISVQDRVFGSPEHRSEHYTRARDAAFIVAVNCTSAGATCFCRSAGTGPKCERGFDLALTEIVEEGRHEFLVEIGSVGGADVMADVPGRPAGEDDEADAEARVDRARSHMGRTLDTNHLRNLLQRNFDHPRWEEIAERCLSCANCTLVCPTCFCSSIEDTSDLSGEIAERWTRWGSCFNEWFSYTHGGSVRDTISSRYRQWMTHKLSTWFDQFGTSGCVGCGRCITWCPVGIDITEEARVIRERDGERQRSASKAEGVTS